MRAMAVIVAAALLQAMALYALQRSLDLHQWPATQMSWLLALCGVAVFLPTSLQLLVDHVRRPALWVLLALLAAAFFGFGWQHGVHWTDPAHERPTLYRYAERDVEFAFVLLVWWLMVLPFLQSRLGAGRWTLDYGRLFRHSWHNVIMLAEAAFFTGIFWLILEPWRFGFFHRLFEHEVFEYPVTALVFGCSLFIAGVEPRLTGALEPLLNLLKWLACVALVLLTTFTVALGLSLWELDYTDHHTIGAAWLLGLVALVVLFLNAAYRGGKVSLPNRRWIAIALRVCLPLVTLLALTALYCLIVRTRLEGLTVERMWAFVVAGAAVLYCAGYSVAALRRRPWMAWIAQVNVAVALLLIATIGAYLTPLLSPQRLSADSQFRRILEEKSSASESRFQYLRFSVGAYGRERLQQLERLQDHPDAQRLRQQARAAMALRYVGQTLRLPVNLDSLLGNLTVYPRGHTLDPELRARVGADLEGVQAQPLSGVFADLDGDGVEEFVLLGPWVHSRVYQLRAGRWQYLGGITEGHQWEQLRDRVEPSLWRQLVIEGQRPDVETEK
jgi:hypothetical protein